MATPDSAHLVPGGTATFDVRVFDQRRDEITPEWASRVHWSIPFRSTIATLDTLDSGVSVTALEPGTILIRAELGRGQRNIPVFIRPVELDHVVIEPDSLLLSTSSGRRTAMVRLFDAAGRELSPVGYRISWEIANEGFAEVPGAAVGTLWETRVGGVQRGRTRLKVIVNDVIGFADVYVVDVPIPPSAVEVAALSSTSLEVTWTRVFGVNRGYRVYRSESSGSGYVLVASPGEFSGPAGQLATTYVDFGLQPGTTYFYVVEACNASGCSERSPEESGTTGAGGVSTVSAAPPAWPGTADPLDLPHPPGNSSRR